MGNIFRKKRGAGVLRPTRRQIPVITSKGITRAKKPRKPLAGPGKDAVTSRLANKENLKLCVQRKLGGIGDVLMTTPVVKALKLRYPDAEITYATDPHYYQGDLFDILQGNPYIDHLVNYRGINPQEYQLFVDITGICPPVETRSNPPINRIDLFARHVGIRLDDHLPDYIVTEEEKIWAKQWIQQKFGSAPHPIVLVHTASVDHKRTWPIEKYVKLLAQLAHERPEVRFIVLDHNKKRATWDLKNCIGIQNFGIRQTAALIWASDLFVGPDSGPLHIAGALEKEIVSIFGSTHPDARINYYDGAVAVTCGLPCEPCWYGPCSRNLQCMRDLTVAKVKTAVLDKLDSRVPEALRHDQRIRIQTDPLCSMEGKCVANNLKIALSRKGINVEFNPNSSYATDVVIDVLKTSSIVKPLTGKPATGALNLCFPMIDENTLGRPAVQRLASTYDGLICLNKSNQLTVGGAGIAAKTYVLPPILSSRPRKIPTTGRFISVVDSVVEENLANLSKAMVTIGEEITIYISNVNQFNSLPPYSNVHLKLFSELSDYSNIWDGAAHYVELNGYATGWYLTDAMCRGLSVVAGDYNTIKWISDNMVYKVPVAQQHPIVDSKTSKHVGIYSTHTVKDITGALETVKALASTTTDERLKNSKLMIRSSDKSLKRLMNVINKGL